MGKRPRNLALVLLGAFLGACGFGVNGQRTTWRYDDERDVIQLLVHSDGIHELEEGEENPEEQLEKYVSGGGVLLLGGNVGFSRKDLEEAAAREEAPPAARAFARRFADGLRLTVVGHYRDGAGRIGALQYVEIANATKLVAAANAALNEFLLTEEPTEDWRRTHARMLPGAEEGRQWIFRDGNALGIGFPAHPREWLRHRFGNRPGLEPTGSGDWPNYLSLLGMGPIGLEESTAGVRFRIGDPSRPVPIRNRTEFQGSGGLDEVVERLAPADLDALLADRILGRTEEEPTPAIAALLAWGPPEDRARALIRRAEGSEGEERAAALAKLAAFADEWNRTVGLPEAPEGGLQKWWAWYDEVLDGPYGD